MQNLFQNGEDAKMTSNQTFSNNQAIQCIENIAAGLTANYLAHMRGHPDFPRGKVERAKLVVEQLLESKGFELSYKEKKHE